LNDDYIACFQSKDPKQIITLLELKASQKVIPGKTLIFLDEIQAAPQVLATLRYFYEILPQLHIIAAGSLLDFILEEHSFSMPVGRIEYMHLGPLNFKVFLKGIGKEQLGNFIEDYHSSMPFPVCLKLFKFIRIAAHY
jgi:predicted AAA+ superfamily ATPase